MPVTSVRWICLLVLIAFAGHAQKLTQGFTDQEVKLDSYVRVTAYEPGFVYLAGSSTNSCDVVPFVAKVSMADGSMLWNTNSNSSLNISYYRSISAMTIVGNAVYVFVDASGTSEAVEIWKIDKNTGVVLWRGQLPPGSRSVGRNGLYGYSDTHVLVYSYYSLYVLNAQTGVTEKTHDDRWGTFMGVTPNAEILVYDTDAKAIKLVRNFDFTTPETLVSFPYNASPCYNSRLNVHFVDKDKFLVLASADCGMRAIVDYTQKKIMWKTEAPYGTSYEISDYVIQDGYLYASFRNLYVGGTATNFAVSKMDITTGQPVWTSLEGFTTNYPGSEGVYSHMGQASAKSVCVDGNGDVYVTGTANAQGAPGDMGIIKFAGTTGKKVYEEIITESDKDFDYYSEGVKAIAYNGAPYFIGNVVTGSNYVFNRSEAPPNPGNNITLVQLQPSDGTVVKRYTNYGGRKVENSFIKKIASYKDGKTLILQNKGRHAYLSCHSRTMDVLWETELKANKAYYYGQQSVDLAVDAAGNIGVLTMYMTLSSNFKAGATRPMAFVVTESGAIKQEITSLGGYTACDAYADGAQFFFCTTDGSYTHITKADADGTTKAVYFTNDQLPTKAAGRRMGSMSNNKLVVLSEYFSAALVDKTTMAVTQLGRLLSSSDFSSPEDMLVANDTLYAVAYNSDRDYTALLCYSLTAKKTVWRNPGSSGNYYRVERDAKGDIYALGTGQYSGMFIRKVKGSTGVSLWYNLLTYANDIEANDLFIDKIRNEVAITGYRTISGKSYYATVIFETEYGSRRLLSVSSQTGQGLTIGQDGNGNILSGGELTRAEVCGSYGTVASASYATSAMKPIAITASQDQEDRVTLRWENGGAATHYRIYRNTTDNWGWAMPISGYVTATTFDDMTAEIATPYYYYISAALDQSGNAASSLSDAAVGFRILSPPVMDTVMARDDKALHVSWAPPAKATAYRLHRAMHGIPAEAEPVTDWTNATTFADAQREPGVSYYYFVQAALSSQGDFASHLSTGREGKVPVITGNEPAQDETVSVYPSPFSDKLSIRYASGYRGEITISLITPQGTTAASFQATKQASDFDATYELDTVRPGMYILRIREGRQEILRKIVKQ